MIPVSIPDRYLGQYTKKIVYCVFDQLAVLWSWRVEILTKIIKLRMPEEYLFFLIVLKYLAKIVSLSQFIPVFRKSS
jgi:hypothetical protein